jgi:hypothetical protein
VELADSSGVVEEHDDRRSAALLTATSPNAFPLADICIAFPSSVWLDIDVRTHPTTRKSPEGTPEIMWRHECLPSGPERAEDIPPPLLRSLCFVDAPNVYQLSTPGKWIGYLVMISL